MLERKYYNMSKHWRIETHCQRKAYGCSQYWILSRRTNMSFSQYRGKSATSLRCSLMNFPSDGSEVGTCNLWGDAEHQGSLLRVVAIRRTWFDCFRQFTVRNKDLVAETSSAAQRRGRRNKVVDQGNLACAVGGLMHSPIWLWGLSPLLMKDNLRLTSFVRLSLIRKNVQWARSSSFGRWIHQKSFVVSR